MSARSIAVVGTGPAGLMAASRALSLGARVTLFEKRRAPGRKLLVAGSSGLNITYSAESREAFAAFYRDSAQHLRPILDRFGAEDWIAFIERELGIKTFEGTSRRWFVEGMKAPALLKAWEKKLRDQGALFRFEHELTGFESTPQGVRLRFGLEGQKPEEADFDAAILALGGGSWEPSETPLRWTRILDQHGIARSEFQASNCGFQIDWPPALLKEAEGLPIKNVILRTQRGERAGDLVITRYGLEGTPVYAVGESGPASLDLKPDLSLEALLARLTQGKEALSPIRAAQKRLALSPGASALLFHLTPEPLRKDARLLAERIKSFPLSLGARQPIEEAISSSGGIHWEELDSRLSLRRFPSLFLAGEMIDWDAPTGGFLIQACVSTGWVAGSEASTEPVRHSSY